jgi:hypothetical protein
MHIIELVLYLVVAVLAFVGQVRFAKTFGNVVTVGDLIPMTILSLVPIINVGVLIFCFFIIGLTTLLRLGHFDWMSKRVF